MLCSAVATVKSRLWTPMRHQKTKKEMSSMGCPRLALWSQALGDATQRIRERLSTDIPSATEQLHIT